MSVHAVKRCEEQKEGERREKRDQSFAERFPAPVETVRWSGEVTIGWPAIRGATAIHHNSIFSPVLPLQPVGTVKESYLHWEKSEKRAIWEEKQQRRKGDGLFCPVAMVMRWARAVAS